MDRDKIGIYVNPSEGKAVRITSPYWLPEEPEWKLVTNDPNATLVSIRSAITEEKRRIELIKALEKLEK